MFKDHYTIFITPPKGRKTRQFSFLKSTFYILVLFLFILIIGNCIAISVYIESAHLKEENAKLKTEKKELEKVARIVNEIEKEESFIRDFFGIEKSGSNMGCLGLGGVNPNSIDTSYTIPQDTGVTVSHNNNKQQIPLIEKALFLRKDLQKLKEELIDRKSEWDTKPTIMPIKTDEYWISSGFGWRKSPFTDLREFHSGLDISAKQGTLIIAPADGKVISVGKDRYTGKFIKIKHNDRFITIYGHLQQHKVKEGQKVKRGDIIGLMGNTGMSTGYHLHYEIIKDGESVNPFNHILNLNTANDPLAMR